MALKITQARHARGYTPTNGMCDATAPVLCPEGMLRQLAAEPCGYVGALFGHGELNAVVAYRGARYAVAIDTADGYGEEIE